jgi:ABC-type sugar transport system ATPase subunit
VLLDESGTTLFEVLVVEPTGSQLHVHLTAAERRLVASVPADRNIQPGDRVHVRLREDRLHVFAA